MGVVQVGGCDERGCWNGEDCRSGYRFEDGSQTHKCATAYSLPASPEASARVAALDLVPGDDGTPVTPENVALYPSRTVIFEFTRAAIQTIIWDHPALGGDGTCHVYGPRVPTWDAQYYDDLGCEPHYEGEVPVEDAPPHWSEWPARIDG